MHSFPGLESRRESVVGHGNLPFHLCQRQEREPGRGDFPAPGSARRAANVVHAGRSPGFRADSGSIGIHAARLPVLRTVAAITHKLLA